MSVMRCKQIESTFRFNYKGFVSYLPVCAVFLYRAQLYLDLVSCFFSLQKKRRCLICIRRMLLPNPITEKELPAISILQTFCVVYKLFGFGSSQFQCWHKGLTFPKVPQESPIFRGKNLSSSKLYHFDKKSHKIRKGSIFSKHRSKTDEFS